MLSQSAGYAILALGYIASQPGKTVLIREIADATKIPAPYLGKIINALGRKGFVITQRGIGGGVTLTPMAKSFSLYDLCVALNEPIVRQKCMLGIYECIDRASCRAHPFWKSYREQYINMLKQMTLEDIAEHEVHRQQLLTDPFDASPGETGESDRSNLS
jgi:Rrf2 family protein